MPTDNAYVLSWMCPRPFQQLLKNSRLQAAGLHRVMNSFQGWHSLQVPAELAEGFQLLLNTDAQGWLWVGCWATLAFKAGPNYRVSERLRSRTVRSCQSCHTLLTDKAVFCPREAHGSG